MNGVDLARLLYDVNHQLRVRQTKASCYLYLWGFTCALVWGLWAAVWCVPIIIAVNLGVEKLATRMDRKTLREAGLKERP